MPWADSEAILNDSVQAFYREPGVVVATGRPLCGVFYEPSKDSNDDDRSYHVDMSNPQPQLIVFSRDLLADDLPNGGEVDLTERRRRFTVVDRQPESYGQTKLMLQEYAS